MTSIIRVSADSRPGEVGGCIANVYREQGRAYVQAIGAGAVNQAVKGFIIARGYLAMDGIDIAFAPAFVVVEIDGLERTAVRFEVAERTVNTQ